MLLFLRILDKSEIFVYNMSVKITALTVYRSIEADDGVSFPYICGALDEGLRQIPQTNLGICRKKMSQNETLPKMQSLFFFAKDC